MNGRATIQARTALSFALLALGTFSLCRCSLLVDLDLLDDGPVGETTTDGAPADAVADSIATPDAPSTGAIATTLDGAARDSAGFGPVDGGATTAPGDAADPDDALGAVAESGADSGSSSADAIAPSDGGPAPDGGTGDACTLVTHANGVGETWQDCAPLDTFDEEEAMSACTAFGQGCVVEATCNVLDVYTFSGSPINQTTYSWVYGTAGPVSLHPGDVLVFPRGQAPCSSLPSPSAKWQ